VLVADDHDIVRGGVINIIKEKFSRVAITEARDGEEALQKCLATPWDLVILDITMPKQNGIEVLRQAKRQRPDLCVIILSMHSAPQYVLMALKAGASGYVGKAVATEELGPAMHAVFNGETYVSPELAERLGGTLRRG
ncbi:MAG: response regulator, partial [Anaerolineales bacterium]